MRPRVPGDSDCDETSQSMDVEIEQQTAAASDQLISSPEQCMIQEGLADSQTGRSRVGDRSLIMRGAELVI